jgi:general secretion pathway protein L
MSRKVLGLDIGDNAVSGVLISSSLRGNVMEAATRVPFEESRHDPGKALFDALGFLTEELDISGSVCNVSLPASNVCFRNLHVPFREEKKIKQVLPFELEPTLPHPVENLVIAYRKTGSPSNESSNLITAAVEKTKIETLLDVLSAYKIDPEIITIGGYPAALCLADTSGLPDNWVLCDLGRNTLSLFFAANGQIVLARSTLTGLPETAAAGPELCTQIKRTLLAFEDIYPHDYEPEIFFISGSGCDSLDWEQEIAHNLEIPVGKADLTQNKIIKAIQNQGQISEPDKMNNSLALAYLELAGLKGLNFRQGPFERKKQWVIHRKSILTSSLVALLVFILAFSNILLDTYLLGKKVTRLNREIEDIFTATLPDVKRIVDPLQQMQVKIQDARQNLLLPSQTGKNIRTIDILDELSTGIPEKTDVELTRVVISRENILLSGNTDTFNSVDDIQNRLEKSPVFRKVTISSANMEKSGNRINFKLKVQL